MAFIRDDRQRIANDKDRGVSISFAPSASLDTTNAALFNFEGSELSFKFIVNYIMENRKFMEKGKLTERAIAIEYRINEFSLKNAIASALKAKGLPPLSAEKYETIKSTIQEGLCVLSNVTRADDGSLVVPEFSVTFTNGNNKTPFHPN